MGLFKFVGGVLKWGLLLTIGVPVLIVLALVILWFALV